MSSEVHAGRGLGDATVLRPPGTPRAHRHSEQHRLPTPVALSDADRLVLDQAGFPCHHDDGEAVTATAELYDRYHASVYRFLYYRLGSTTLAEDVTAETFFRALRSMHGFQWQGKDSGAWLMTIARNLTADHFRAGRTRVEQTTERRSTLGSATAAVEGEVLTLPPNESLLATLAELPIDQRECLIMRFLQGLSLAETADVLGRSTAAIKQLQLRALRALAQLLPTRGPK